MGNILKSTTAPPDNIASRQTGPESDFLAVLYDYPSTDISEPIFNFGEKLRVISDEGGWWRVLSLRTGRENYIPGKCVAKVYHGWLFDGVGREKSEELLQLPETKIGSFMIRQSETKKENADGLCCVLTTPCLTQQFMNHAEAVGTQEAPVVRRRKQFDWRSVKRVPLTAEETENTLETDDSFLSYGLRQSIASYLSLAEDDSFSFTSNNMKKNRQSQAVSDVHDRKSILSLRDDYSEDYT
ncbi:hypothetical protein FKM82_005773 [Ascaphus truei]